MKRLDKLLTVDDLNVSFSTFRGIVRAVQGVSFEIFKGEVMGVVGESGCGKSVTAMSILRLIDEPPGKITGKIYYQNKDMMSLGHNEINKIRGKDISMIFQNPGTALNPVFTIGEQMVRVIRNHRRINKDDAKKEVCSILELVGLPEPERVINNYPHQLSGGMKQRIIIGMALSCKASLLIADEPTTALDVTIQAQILKLLIELKEKLHISIMLITHDIGVAAQTCDRIMVMYAGKIVEVGPTVELLRKPLHPYTAGLLGCLPNRVNCAKNLKVITGSVPDPINPSKKCSFYPRCSFKKVECAERQPELKWVESDRLCACFLR